MPQRSRVHTPFRLAAEISWWGRRVRPVTAAILAANQASSPMLQTATAAVAICDKYQLVKRTNPGSVWE
jgi:hypothetical protein